MVTADHKSGWSWVPSSQVTGKSALQAVKQHVATKASHNGCPLSPKLPDRAALLPGLSEAK